LLDVFLGFFFLQLLLPLKAALFLLAPEWAALGFSFAALCAWGAWVRDFAVAVEWPASRVIRARFRDLGQGMAGPSLAPLIAAAEIS